MNQVQTIALLNTLSVPSFYGQADVGQTLPFITIHSEQPDNFKADNLVYCEKWNFRLDLYTSYVLHAKDVEKLPDRICLPLYMAGLLNT